jgi:hypothetical protein
VVPSEEEEEEREIERSRAYPNFFNSESKLGYELILVTALEEYTPFSSFKSSLVIVL